MKLIGMLDSPYVRRVAVSMQLLGLRFEHESVSVFRGFAQFQRINPVVKAPTFICDDGTVLMDSTLILEYAEALARSFTKSRSLMPADTLRLQRELRLIGLALAACEKSVQIVYERHTRPPDKQHEPWVERVTGQMLAALGALDTELTAHRLVATSASITQAGVSAAVVWEFVRQVQPELASPVAFPTLAAFAAQAEQLAEFKAAPHGDGTYCRTDA